MFQDRIPRNSRLTKDVKKNTCFVSLFRMFAYVAIALSLNKPGFITYSQCNICQGLKIKFKVQTGKWNNNNNNEKSNN